MVPVCLAVGGSDPSGGAGIQADLKTFHRHGVYGAAAIALLTVQDTTGVKDVRVLDAEFLRAQILPVLSDLPVAAVKTGALGSIENAQAVARCLGGWSGFLVVDPVLSSKGGAALLDERVFGQARELFARADLVTPNLDEASLLLRRAIRSETEMDRSVRELREALGCRAVLLKGGHLAGENTSDMLCDEDGICLFPGRRVDSRHTHGTGCALASAVAAHRAQGRALREAVGLAKAWLEDAVRTAPGLGAGHGPLNLSWESPRERPPRRAPCLGEI
jgi:hydroxymethylpyrimidine/phosphomethylpyrimidine kinase